MTNTTTHLINPHGGILTNLLVDSDRQVELKAASRDWPSSDITPRQLCDLELLLNGGFSPLTGFMGKADFDRVVSEMRLADGTLWPMPITLDVPESVASGLKNGSMLALRDPEGVMLAALRVDDVYQPDREAEAKGVFGTDSPDHPGVAYTLKRSNPYYVGGRLEGLQLPSHYDFRSLRNTPADCARSSRVSDGDVSSPFKRGTPCTAPITSSPSAPRGRWKRTS